jgi:enterochelin esterase-like enzyme/glyoxylase-like metal-dependent hydrolase (beta-lactamase superfamily II)
MAEAFKTTPVAAGVWHIEDAQGGITYLVAGAERALLIDTGWGEGDPSSGVSGRSLATHITTLTSLPLLVVNTHGHRDHISGNSQFPEVHIHTNDLPLAQESGARLIPIHDGYVFDLGGRALRVIGVPGHSPGSIGLLDEQARILFSGDTPRPGPLWLHVPTALNVRAARASLARLRRFVAPSDLLAPSHGRPAPIGSILDDLIACADKVLSGELIGRPEESRFGPCLLAEWGSAAILYLEDRVHLNLAGLFGPRMVSPEVHADRRVTFRLKAPKAERVLLASTPVLNALGSADNALAFQEVDEEGIWSLTVGPLPPDIYDYLYMVDGVALADPNNHAVQTGLMPPHSLLIVPSEKGDATHEARDVPHGTLHHHWYTSQTVGDVRDVYVYTPPHYEDSPERTYPVLYLLHGGGDDAGGWSTVGCANTIVDNLLAEGRIEPMIVVMPLGQAVSRVASWEERMVRNTSLFEQDMFADVMPLVESTYRIRAARDHRAMAGLSMGGGQTDQIGLAHLDAFSYIGILSAGGQGFAERHADLLADPEGTNAKLNLLFLGCGTLDLLAAEGMQALSALLTEKGIRHQYWTLDGTAHTWVVWRAALGVLLPLLFK